MKFLNILKKIILYSTIFFIAVCFSFYLYIENGAKIYFPEKERTELVQQIKSAPQLPENFVNFYSAVYPKSLENTFWKRTYRIFTSLYSNRNDKLISQNIANISSSPFMKHNNRRILNNVFLIRFIEQNSTQEECLNYQFQKFDFLYNRIGLDAVSKDLFKKSIKNLQPTELAEIIALSENPRRNDRYRNPERAEQKVKVVLERYQQYLYEHKNYNELKTSK